MIQRIQSLYLLLVAALLVCALRCPWGSFFANDASFTYEAFAVTQSVGTEMATIPFWALGVLLCVCAVVALVTIFCFKNRVLQTRLCIFNMLALLGFYVVFFVFMLLTKSKLSAEFGFQYGISFPLISMILLYLSIRSIIKDEKKVRAYERIR